MLKGTLVKDSEELEILGGRVANAPENPRERGEVRSQELLLVESMMPQRFLEKETEKLEILGS
jgi:hypothetical protein